MTDPAEQEGAAPAAPSIRRVVLVVAHPDDETLTAGGLVAALARRCEVTVVTCTRGEQGEMIGAGLAPLLDDRAALAAHRVDELGRAVAALGVHEQVFLDAADGGPRLVDSGMAWADDAQHVTAVPAPDAGPDAFSVLPVDRAVTALTAVLDRVEPDLVLVDEPGGGYGHPDHRRTHEVTMLAVERATRRPAFVAWPVRPVSAVLQAQEWLRERDDRPTTGTDGAPLTLPEAEGPLPSIVVPDEDVDAAVDVTASTPAVVAAMSAHASQVQAVGLAQPPSASNPAIGWFALSNGVLQPLLRAAWLRVAPGHGDPAALRTALGDLLAPPPEPSGAWFKPTMIGFSLVLGVVVGAVGTVFHRTWEPWGLVVALVALLAAGVLARTFVDRVGHVLLGGAALATTLAMTYVRPGGDVLVTDEPIGLAWIVGVLVVGLVLPALAPRAWFADDDD